MKVLFLGTGTSVGVPTIGCQCPTCRSADRRDNRLRSSVLLTKGEERVLIDCGPDFRQQMLVNQINSLSAVVLTHEHYDHVSGLDDIRPFGQMNVYAEKRVLEAIQNNMPYSFADKKYRGVPEFLLNEICAEEPFCINDWEFQPVRLWHMFLPVLGYRTGRFGYLTDFNRIEEPELAKLRNLDVLVLDALRITTHPSHNSLDEALLLAEKINARRTYLTHLSHDMGLHAETEKRLPENVRIAYDGLELECE